MRSEIPGLLHDNSSRGDRDCCLMVVSLYSVGLLIPLYNEFCVVVIVLRDNYHNSGSFYLGLLLPCCLTLDRALRFSLRSRDRTASFYLFCRSLR